MCVSVAIPKGQINKFFLGSENLDFYLFFWVSRKRKKKERERNFTKDFVSDKEEKVSETITKKIKIESDKMNVWIIQIQFKIFKNQQQTKNVDKIDVNVKWQLTHNSCHIHGHN